MFALLDWLSQQEHYSSGDIYFIQRGYAAHGIDGAYAEDYCYLLSRALFSDPVAYAKALARSTARKWERNSSSSRRENRSPRHPKKGLSSWG